MSERLKQIWAGFEETTSRRLTGGGVDKIHVPSRVDWQAEDQAFLPENFNAPAEAAFSALSAQLEANTKKFGRKKKAKTDEGNEVTLAAAPAEATFNGGAELLKGLRSTALRTERTEIDYNTFLADGGGKVLQTLKKRKKRFGLF